MNQLARMPLEFQVLYELYHFAPSALGWKSLAPRFALVSGSVVSREEWGRMLRLLYREELACKAPIRNFQSEGFGQQTIMGYTVSEKGRQALAELGLLAASAELKALNHPYQGMIGL